MERVDFLLLVNERIPTAHAVAMRYDMRAHVFHGTVTGTVTAIRLRPRP